MQEKIAALLALRAAAAGQPAPTVAQNRASFDSRSDLYPLPGDTVVSKADAGGVPARWITFPGADAGRVLLYLHGGGYQIGSFHSHGELAARLGRAAAGGCCCPSTGSRRSIRSRPPSMTCWPPGAGCGAAGLDASALAVAGDSAGGGLAVAMMTALRDSGEDLPAAAVLMSPWTDLSCSGASMTERVDEDPIFVPDTIRSLPPPTWPAPIPARRWRRRCSPGWTACRRC